MDGDAFAIRDVGVVLLFGAAMVLALGAKWIGDGLARLVTWVPGVGHAAASLVRNAIVAPAQEVADSAGKKVAQGLSGLVDSLALLVGLPLALGLGVKDAITYLWRTALDPRIRRVVNAIVDELPAARLDVSKLTKHIVAAAGVAVKPELDLIRKHVAELTTELKTAKKWAATAAATAAATIRGDVTAGYRDVQAEAAALPREALQEWERLLSGKDLATLAGGAGALVLLRHIVTTIAAESGLENEECRGKIKQVCATDPTAWASLIGGLAAVGFLFDLRAIVTAAEDISGAVVDIVKQAA